MSPITSINMKLECNKQIPDIVKLEARETSQLSDKFTLLAYQLRNTYGVTMRLV